MTRFPGNGERPPGGTPAPLSIRQPDRGYRFSIDSVLLAGFAAPFCRGDVLDLGTGCGVLLLLLSRLSPGMRSGTGVEIQGELRDCAERNFRENGPVPRLRAIGGDFRRDVPGVPVGGFDLVVANPPFGRLGHGRRNPHPGKEAARHEISCSLPELFASAARRLSPVGRFALILPADRHSEALACAGREEMGCEALRRVHAKRGTPASRVLLLSSRGAGDSIREEPPLHLHEGEGKYCPEVERICRLFRSGTPPAPG